MNTHSWDELIYIVGAGAQTPVGRSVLSAAAAVRCGISAYADHPFVIDKYGEPIVVARAEWLDEVLPLEDRIVTLAVDAANEALFPLISYSKAPLDEVYVHFALSDETLASPVQRGRVLDKFSAKLGFSRTGSAIEPIIQGHAGGLLALENAVGQLRRGEVPFCLVGGADSWLDPQRLDALDLSGRVHSINYGWGFTPGEGAGFCLIATGDSARRFHLTPLAEIAAVFTSEETKLMNTQMVCLGEALSVAFRGVLDAHQRVAHSYCDFNGETYRADEYAFTMCRMSECFDDAGSFTAAAECWGDVGAASGPLAMTLPVAAWARGYDKGPVALVWASSADGPLRGAARLNKSLGLAN